MSGKSESNEGAAIAIGILVIIICVAGSLVTNTNILYFFLILLFMASVLSIAAGLIFGVTVLFIYTFRREAGDKRTIMTIVKAEYNSNKLILSYRLLFRLLGDYFAENRTYVYVVQCINMASQKVIWSVQHPLRAMRRDWDRGA